MNDAAGHSEASSSRMAAIGLFCGATALFAVLDATAKYLSAELPPPQVAWLRFAGHFFLTLVLFRSRFPLAQFATRRPWLQVGRGLVLVFVTICNFTAVKYLQLTETISIFFLGPLIVAALSTLLLKEHVGPRRWAAIVVGFVGVMIVVQPGSSDFKWAFVFSFGAVFGYAFYAITTRMLAGVDRTETSLLYSALVGTLLLLPVMPYIWVWPSGPWQWAMIAFMALTAGTGHYLLIVAHRHTGASVLAPFTFTSILWMTTIGYVVFDDVPAWTTFLGAGIVIASGLYLLYRERRVKGEVPREPGPAMARSGV